MTDLMQDLYEPHVKDARRLLSEHPTMVALLDPAIEPVLLERFLIQFCALGVQMTRPVSGWIRRAGERCQELGLDDIGKSLVKHAQHEEGHDQMLVDDARLLVTRWNERSRGRSLDLNALLTLPATPAIAAYVELHEVTIASDQPYGQVAIELEIERMSTTFGPQQLALCKRVLGPDVLEGLSFIKEHVAIDVGHTALNEKMVGRLLSLRPEAAPRLARIGGEALHAYVGFFGECLDAANQDVAPTATPRRDVTASRLN